MIAISFKDYQECGCVECGCDFAYNNGGLIGGGVVPVKCGECGNKFVVLADGLQQSTMGFGTGKKDNNGETIFYYPTLQEHPRKGIAKHKFVRPDVRPENGIGEFCSPRGVGYDLACFVKSKEAGERVVKMFENIQAEYNNERCFSCWLDYRPYEPLRIQVKINYNAVGEHNAALLSQLISKDGVITEDKIKQARNIEWNFANMWKYITSNKIWNCVDLDFMQNLVKYSEDITQEDRDSMLYNLKTKRNQLAMFEIYGMYLQINKELKSQNIERAVDVVKHTMGSIDSQLYKNIQGPREYADQRVFHEYLQKDLEELLEVHKNSLQQKGYVKKLK